MQFQSLLNFLAYLHFQVLHLKCRSNRIWFSSSDSSEFSGLSLPARSQNSVFKLLTITFLFPLNNLQVVMTCLPVEQIDPVEPKRGHDGGQGKQERSKGTGAKVKWKGEQR